jgi:hypothetical protein
MGIQHETRGRGDARRARLWHRRSAGTAPPVPPTGEEGPAWPLDPLPPGGARARIPENHSLEPVGKILHRLELDEADIIQLRTETRDILAGLAA